MPHEDCSLKEEYQLKSSHNRQPPAATSSGISGIGIGIGHADKLGVQTRFVMVRIAAIRVKKEPSDPPQST